MSPGRTAPANLAAADARLRAQYVREVLDVLYPSTVGDDETEYLVVPDSRRPRLLVPSQSRRVAAAAVARYAQPQSRLARLKRDAVVAALRTGASAALLRDRVRVPGGPDSFEAYLSTALGQPLHLSVHIGPARANRKPVLQLLTPDARTVGFAKLGISELTRRLVRTEATALTALGNAGLTDVAVPDVLHTGNWRGHEVLVQSALPNWRRRAPLSPDRCARAMREVAESCGTTSARLSASAYWATLNTRLAAVADHPEGHQLGRAARRINATAGEVELTFGAWHGDWAPWNMRPLPDRILLWDWERFTTGIPLGYDALHLDLQRRVSTSPDGPAAVTRTIAAAADLLAPFGVVNPAAVRLTTLLYLIDLATRYVADRQAEAGARLGVLGSWLLPVLLSTVEDL
jgi:hypothetical protein